MMPSPRFVTRFSLLYFVAAGAMLERMHKDFRQIIWDQRLDEDWKAILNLALREDLGTSGDWTSKALVDEQIIGRAAVVARHTGIVAGLPGVPITLAAVDSRLDWRRLIRDGQPVSRGDCVGMVEGPARELLAAERVLLNLIGRLSGIATLTRQYVDAVAGTAARIYDTRKTTPGWRRLEKYAVRCGGGWNHRGGLDEAVLIKDNHLAIGAKKGDGPHLPERPFGCCAQMGTVPFFPLFSPADAVRRAREFVTQHGGDPAMIIEIEVDTLDQLDAVLRAEPDIVLLDNMGATTLREAVRRRNAVGPTVELEASGGVNLATVRAIAESGVDRISVGALTHSAVGCDFGLDWT
jgi:nicotinate-nucleotide pyrophosphorylase (carboxylating)